MQAPVVDRRTNQEEPPTRSILKKPREILREPSLSEEEEDEGQVLNFRPQPSEPPRGPPQPSGGRKQTGGAVSSHISSRIKRKTGI